MYYSNELYSMLYKLIWQASPLPFILNSHSKFFKYNEFIQMFGNLNYLPIL